MGILILSFSANKVKNIVNIIKIERNDYNF